MKVAVVSADAFRKFLRVLVFIGFLGFILLQVQNSISSIHIIQNSEKSKF
jgi:type IV secretory pathway TrbL component